MLFITILNMSITASIVALAVILIRLPLRKAPKIFSYLLWGVVLFRLVCPFSIESAFSLMPAPANLISQDIVHLQNPATQSGVRLIDRYTFAAINDTYPPLIPESNAITNAGNELPISPKNSPTPIYTFFKTAGYVWLIGFLALLSYAAIGYIRLKRRVYYATLVRANIFETDAIKTPFVLGFIRPKIYIPLGIGQLEHNYVLQHEETHIRRYDYLIKPLAFIIFALHWFNPLIWVAYLLLTKDLEMSCDEAVLRKADADIRSAYSSSLLNLSLKKGALLAPLAFGESAVKDRVKNVLNFQKPSRVSIVVMIILVTLFSTGFTVNRADHNPTIISPDNTGKIIERNLEIIASSPAKFSWSLDHINANKAEYDEIVACGPAALPYLLPGSDNGLKEAIMTAARRDILKSELNLYFVPNLELFYRAQGSNHYSNAFPADNLYWPNSHCWITKTGDLIQIPPILHPLAAVEYMDIITKTDDLDAITLAFSISPRSYSVVRWSDTYLGDSKAYYQYYERVKVINNTICLSPCDKGYIYKIYAILPQGTVHYSFYLK